jgi:catechol 2,3-dioxygenase-like lactoylglutathione lyase family enzyme
MTEFHSACPVFLVPDVAATVRWYGEVLGFEIQTHPESAPFHWAMASRDGVRIMFQWAPDYRKPDLLPYRPEGGVWDAYLWLSKIEPLFESIRDRAEVMQAPYDQPYGRREFILRDPNGYVLVLSEEANA